MKPILQSGLKTFQIIILTVLFGVSLSDVTYDEIIALKATCPGSDSCNQPMTPDTLAHCSCSSFCSLLGTCCVDSKYRNKYPKPLNNIECQYIPDRTVHRFVPIITTCDQDLEYDETTEKLCNGDAEELNDPFLKIPVTDPISGISYKNHYCFTCNEHFGAEEPIWWNPEINIKANDSFKQTLRSNKNGKTQGQKDNGPPIPDLHYDSTKRVWVQSINNSPIPNLHYDSPRETWVLNYNKKNAIDVQFYGSLPTELRNVTPVCYELVLEMVSECASDWKDENIARKCSSYMAWISIKRIDKLLPRYYRNPHCAICNYENIGDMKCYVEENTYNIHIFATPDDLFIKLFYLKNETPNCEDNMVYDQFAKRCRRMYGAKRRKVIGGNSAKPTVLPQRTSTSKNLGYPAWLQSILNN